MSIKNLIKKEQKFNKEYFAKVVSNQDSLGRGRLQVTINSVMGTIPFWVNCTNVIGKVSFQMIPEPGDTVTVKFKNKDIYSGEWELKGSPTNSANIDPKKYGFKDNSGNSFMIDRGNNCISTNTIADTITASDTFVNGNFGTSVGISKTYILPDGTVLMFNNGILIGGS